MTQTYTYRSAASNDQAGILKVFAEVAAEVPTEVRPQTAGLIDGWVAGGRSWVALDAAGTIVGYALAEMSNNETSLVYVGVAKKARGQRVCSTLISKLNETGAPINTDVRANNTSSMVERFERLGFVKVDANKDRTKLRWEKKATI